MSTGPGLERILLVDDESDIRMLASMTLEVGGFAVAVAGSGRKALETAPDFAPDLVLLDVSMPGLDGRETQSALRLIPACAETPVIFVTASAESEDIAEYLAAGAIGVIEKPLPLARRSRNKPSRSSTTRRSSAGILSREPRVPYGVFALPNFASRDPNAMAVRYRFPRRLRADRNRITLVENSGQKNEPRR